MVLQKPRAFFLPWVGLNPNSNLPLQLSFWHVCFIVSYEALRIQLQHVFRRPSLSERFKARFSSPLDFEDSMAHMAHGTGGNLDIAWYYQVVWTLDLTWYIPISILCWWHYKRSKGCVPWRYGGLLRSEMQPSKVGLSSTQEVSTDSWATVASNWHLEHSTGSHGHSFNAVHRILAMRIRRCWPMQADGRRACWRLL